MDERIKKPNSKDKILIKRVRKYTDALEDLINVHGRKKCLEIINNDKAYFDDLIKDLQFRTVKIWKWNRKK